MKFDITKIKISIIAFFLFSVLPSIAVAENFTRNYISWLEEIEIYNSTHDDLATYENGNSDTIHKITSGANIHQAISQAESSQTKFLISKIGPLFQKYEEERKIDKKYEPIAVDLTIVLAKILAEISLDNIAIRKELVQQISKKEDPNGKKIDEHKLKIIDASITMYKFSIIEWYKKIKNDDYYSSDAKQKLIEAFSQLPSANTDELCDPTPKEALQNTRAKVFLKGPQTVVS